MVGAGEAIHRSNICSNCVLDPRTSRPFRLRSILSFWSSRQHVLFLRVLRHIWELGELFATLLLFSLALYVTMVLTVPSLANVYAKNHRRLAIMILGAIPSFFALLQPRGYDSIPVCEDYPVSLDDLEYPTPDIGYCKATEVKDIDSEVVKFCNFEKYERIFHWSGVTEKYGFTEESAMETWGLFQTYFTDFQLGYIKVSDVFEAMRRAICPGVLYPPCNAACDPQYYCLGSFS